MTAPDHMLKPFKTHLHQWGHPYMHISVSECSLPFPGRTYPSCLCDRSTKSGVAIERGETGLEFQDLPVDAARYPELAQSLHAMYLALTAVPAAVSEPALQVGSTETAGSIDRIVARDSAGAGRLPRLRILRGAATPLGIASGTRTVAFAGVGYLVRGHSLDVLIGRDLVAELRLHRGVADIARRALDGPDHERFPIDPHVYFAPNSAFRAVMLARSAASGAGTTYGSRAAQPGSANRKSLPPNLGGCLSGIPHTTDKLRLT